MKKGFTLIELLVVIGIMGILLAISVFGLQGARESSRNAKRKADLELIRSGIEIYKSDCDAYPAALSNPLVGTGASTSCDDNNTYISSVPADPIATRNYLYARTSTTTYELCAALEDEEGTVTCGGSSNCGEICNYKVTNP